MRERLEKVDRLRAAGIDPYSRGFQPTHTTEAAKALLGEAERTEPISVAGRLMVKRQQGGLVFADLQDGHGRIQLMANRNLLGSPTSTSVTSLASRGPFSAPNGARSQSRSSHSSC